MRLPDEELERVSLAASTSTFSVLHEPQCTHFQLAFLLFVLQLYNKICATEYNVTQRLYKVHRRQKIEEGGFAQKQLYILVSTNSGVNLENCQGMQMKKNPPLYKK